jgi:hypothetical protein
MPYEYQEIDYWNGSASAYSGSTSFGYFDGDTQLQTDAPKIASYITGQLGYPVQVVELTDKLIYDNIEQGIMRFSMLTNEFNTKENYFDLIGLSSSNNNFTEKLVVPNLNWALKISDTYGVDAGVPNDGGVSWRSGSIQLTAGQQIYNLKTDYFDSVHPNESSFTIRKIYNAPLPARNAYQQNPILPAQGIPYGIISGFSSGDSTGYGSQLLYPLSWQVSRIQAVKMTREVFGKSYSFELIGANLRIFPIPKTDGVLVFEYTVGSDTDGMNTIDDVIGSPHQIEYDLIPWSKMSKKDKTWTIEYILALCKINLGMIRRKFRSIPYPNGEVSLDGDDLVSEGTVRKEQLEIEYREQLEGLSKERGIQIKVDTLRARKEMLNEIPLGIYKI